MRAARLPDGERERLQALRGAEILDTPPEADFDALTRIAAAICGTPIALVSLLDADRRVVQVAGSAWPPRRLPRDVSFASHAILEPDLMEVRGRAGGRALRRQPARASAGPTSASTPATPAAHRGRAMSWARCASSTTCRGRSRPSSARLCATSASRPTAQIELRRMVAELQRAVDDREQAEVALRRALETAVHAAGHGHRLGAAGRPGPGGAHDPAPPHPGRRPALPGPARAPPRGALRAHRRRRSRTPCATAWPPTSRCCAGATALFAASAGRATARTGAPTWPPSTPSRSSRASAPWATCRACRARTWPPSRRGCARTASSLRCDRSAIAPIHFPCSTSSRWPATRPPSASTWARSRGGGGGGDGARRGPHRAHVGAGPACRTRRRPRLHPHRARLRGRTPAARSRSGGPACRAGSTRRPGPATSSPRCRARRPGAGPRGLRRDLAARGGAPLRSARRPPGRRTRRSAVAAEHGDGGRPPLDAQRDRAARRSTRGQPRASPL